MRAIAATFLLVALALAGCMGNNTLDEVYTCKVTGHKVDLSTVNNSAADGFDKESACPAIVQPSVTFAPTPTAVAFHPVSFTWSVDAGNYSGGHSMLTSLRLSTQSKEAVSGVTPMAEWGSLELGNAAHQDLPASPSTKHTFESSGTYYLRAYAQIRSNDFGDRDYWSPEVKFTVTPVVATGNSTTVTHQLGPVGQQAGQLDTNKVTMALGDGISFKNSDLIEHTFTFDSGPAKPAPVKVAMDQVSTAIPLLIPGTYKVSTDDIDSQTLEITVLAPK